MKRLSSTAKQKKKLDLKARCSFVFISHKYSHVKSVRLLVGLLVVLWQSSNSWTFTKSLKASTKSPQNSPFLVSSFSLYRFYFTSTQQRLTNFHLLKNEKFVRWRRGGEGCRGGNFGVDFEFRSIKRKNQEIIGNKAFPCATLSR